jgi:ABC-type multidrug transport system fused ATPase/permease subunit
MDKLNTKEIPNPYNFNSKELKYFINEIKDFVKDKKNIIYQYYGSILISYPLELIAFSYVASNIYTNISQKKIDIYLLIKNIVIFFVLYGLANLARNYKDYLEVKYIPLLIKHIRENIFNNILFRLKKQDASIKIGDIIARFITIPTSVKDIISDISVLILPKLFKVLIVVCISLFVSLKIGLINLITIIIVGVILYYRNDDCFKYHFMNNENFNNVNQVLQNKLYNIFNIIISNNVNQEIQENKQREQVVYNTYFESKKCIWVTNNIISVILGINVLFILYVIVTKLIQKDIEPKHAITSLVLISYFIPNIITIINMIPYTVNNYANLIESGDFINFITNYTKINGEKHNINGDIVIKKLNFKYGDSKNHVFRNLNITIKKNTSIMIIGKSGSGKSTLMKLLCGFFTIKKGEITINNKDINNIDVEDLRNQLGLMSQNIRMFEDTILNNIKYSNVNITEQDVYNFINKYNIKVYDTIKNNLNTKIKPNETNISGGQKQFAILMRVVLSNKKILILDEPTSALDDYHFQVIKTIMDDLRGNKTVIVISHDNRFQKNYFDNTYILKEQILVKQ